MIEEFLLELDRIWQVKSPKRLKLHIFGAAALLLQMSYTRGTKDADVLEVEPFPQDISDYLKQLAGKQSPLYQRHRLYIEIVKPGVPFLPPDPKFHSLSDLNQQMAHLLIHVLDPVDIVVSKLKPFRPTDIDDIRAVVESDLLPHGELIDRFEKAKDHWLMGSRAHELRQYIENLHAVERDLLHVSETLIDLPRWVDA